MTTGEFTIDPANWEEPKQTFPGVVEESEYRPPSDAYRAASTFSPEMPLEFEGRPVMRWHCRVRRLDAKFVLPDGSHADANRYAQIDSIKWSNRDNKWVPGMSRRFLKNTFIATEWKRVFGQIEPPGKLVGKMAIFDWFEQKSLGRNVVATGILVPVQLLEPTYKYDGEMILIPVSREEETEETGGGGLSSEGEVEVLSEQEATLKALDYLIGKTKAELPALVPSLPAEILSNGNVTGKIATGIIVDELVAAGQITLDGEGHIQRAGLG